MESNSRIAIIQMRSGLDKAANLQRATDLIAEAVRQGAKFIALPETFNCLGTYAEMVKQAEDLPGHTTTALSELAKQYGVFIHCGSIFEKTDHSLRSFNTSVVLAPSGNPVATYRKIHLFDVKLPGNFSGCESRWVIAGDEIVAQETPFGKIGLSICYDLRFPELFRKLSAQGVQLTFVPSAFRQVTGEAHWEILLRARAIENQAYLFAPNQWGEQSDGTINYGHSMVVNPWGEIIARSDGESDSVLTVDINLTNLKNIRRELPALLHRRIDDN